MRISTASTVQHFHMEIITNCHFVNIYLKKTMNFTNEACELLPGSDWSDQGSHRVMGAGTG